MTIQTKEQYQRVRIEAEITLLSALHIGSGMIQYMNERAPDRKENEATDENPLYDTLCLDYQKKPYLPGSSLRGLLRDLAKQFIDESWANKVFGQITDTDRISYLRVQDAFLKPDSTPEAKAFSHSRKSSGSESLFTRIKHGVAIDQVRQVVEAHKLFHYDSIPENSVFDLTVELDNINHEILQGLCSILQDWENKSVSLGRNRLKGDGRVVCSIKKLQVTTANDIAAWLNSHDDKVDYYRPIPIPKHTATPPKAVLSYHLQCHGMMLANDPDRVRVSDEYLPQHVYARQEDGQAFIDGKSIKGLLRAHARKILATLLVNNGVALEAASELADKKLSIFFGSTKQASSLFISHAVADGQPKVVQQAFIAVDRFTGGVKDGALFHAEGLLDAAFTGEITLVDKRIADAEANISTKVNHWWKGLLLHVLRDMMQGDGILGWGKSKGFGCFVVDRMSFAGKEMTNWEQIRDFYQQTELEQWAQALQDYAAELATEYNKEVTT